MKFLFSIAFILIVGASLATVAQKPADELTKQLTHEFSESNFPGFCVAVVDQEKTIYQRGFGYTDIKNKSIYTADTIQPVGSVSKTLIGIALMKAIELGFFTLDMDVSEILDFKFGNPYYPDQAITVRQLATHTSSIVDRGKVYRKTYLFNRNTSNISLNDFLRSYLTKQGKFYSRRNFDRHRPGTTFNYSNIGATLAARLIEIKSGMSFAAFTGKYILQPLKMTDSSWFDDSKNAARRTMLYDPKGAPYPVYASVTYPDGSFRSSCGDLSKYLIAIIKGYRGESNGLLKSNSFREMLNPQFLPESEIIGTSDREPNQGIFFVFRRDGSIGHTGSDYGVSAFMFFDSKTSIGKIFLTNIDVQENPKLATQFAQIWKTLNGLKMENESR